MAGSPRFEVEIGASTADLKKGLQEARQELLKFQKEIRSVRPNIKVSNVFDPSSVEGMRSKLKALTTQYNSLSETQRNSKSVQSNLVAEIKRLQAETDKATSAVRKQRTETQGATGSYREAQQRLTALGKSIREAKGGFDSSNPAIQKQIQQYRLLNEQLKQFDARMGNFQRNVGNYPSAMGALSAVAPGISQLAGKGGGYIGLALGAAQAFKSVSAFDDGLKNVQKTTGLTKKETEDLGQEFVKLSKELQVVSADSLAGYATVAGQLGVKGTQNILAFTEALAKLETASDISGEQGGAEIARLLTLTDGGVQNVKQFGNEIVNLGNNFAATESEILGNATRIAQSTGVYKLGRESVLAYATATKSVGVEAELVGSTIGRTLGTIEGLSRSTKGAAELTKLLGGTQAELQKRFKESSSQVLTEFIGALNKIDKSGGSVNATLERLGINAIRDKTVLGSLATNGFNVLTDAINKTREAGNAMDQEFELGSTKISKQVGRIKIAFDNLVLSIEQGTGLIGKLSVGLADIFATTLDGFSSIVSSKSFKEFFARMSQLSGNQTLSLASGAVGDRIRAEQTNPNGRPRTQLERAVAKSVKGFSEASEEEKLLRIRKQTEAVNARVAEYKAQSDKENLERLTLQSAILAEMNKDYYGHLKAKQKIAAIDSESESKKTKGKSQADIIKEATEAIKNGQIEALRGVDGEMAKIDKKWDAILEKVNKISNVGLKKQQLELAATGRAAEKYAKFLDLFAKDKVSFGQQRGGNIYRNVPTTLTGGTRATAPSTLPGLARMQERYRIINLPKQDDELSKYMQRTLRQGFSSALTGVIDSFSEIGNKSLEIEKKYIELRANASADQIEALKKMERLERKINSGLTSTLNSLVGSLSSLGTRTLSSAVGEGFSTGDFKQLNKLFKGDNAAIGYGSLASSLGGVISGVSKSNAGKTLGNVVSLAGTGAAIGSVIPGIGTAIGAVAGAIVGAVSGILNGAQQKKERELQNLQLLEAKKQTALQNRIAALSYASSIIGQQSSMGVITSIDRNAYGGLVATINGQQIDLVLTRYKNSRG